MTLVSIPEWNDRGVLPPCDPNSPTSVDRSPYRVSLTDLVLRYSEVSSDRRAILKGFLDYRGALHAAGLQRGFQWLDGSFMENVEEEEHSPNDIDVVTFFHLPDGVSEQQLAHNHPLLFDRASVKSTHQVDTIGISLDDFEASLLVRSTAYWYSVWSHQRETFLWKGFIELDLSDADDVAAITNLEAADRQEEET